jgi:hypothetical protein
MMLLLMMLMLMVLMLPVLCLRCLLIKDPGPVTCSRGSVLRSAPSRRSVQPVPQLPLRHEQPIVVVVDFVIRSVVAVAVVVVLVVVVVGGAVRPRNRDGQIGGLLRPARALWWRRRGRQQWHNGGGRSAINELRHLGNNSAGTANATEAKKNPGVEITRCHPSALSL